MTCVSLYVLHARVHARSDLLHFFISEDIFDRRFFFSCQAFIFTMLLLQIWSYWAGCV